MGLCFVPLAAADLARWASRGALEGSIPAFSVTPAMLEAFGLTSAVDEDAEYTALCVASVACLVADQPRLVAVIESDARPAEADLEFGAVRVEDPPWSRVTALFADEPDGAVVDRARSAVRGRPLSQAWDDPLTDVLLAEADLLWHGPGEWSTLVAG